MFQKKFSGQKRPKKRRKSENKLSFKKKRTWFWKIKRNWACCWKFLAYSHPQKNWKKYPKKGTTFFVFRNFHCRVLSFFCDKKNVFLSPKSDKTLQWKFRKTKKVVHFLGYFFSVWGGDKNFFSCCWLTKF